LGSSGGELAIAKNGGKKHNWKHMEVECEEWYNDGCGILGSWLLFFAHL
jgi:hypothetical protein